MLQSVKQLALIAYVALMFTMYNVILLTGCAHRSLGFAGCIAKPFEKSVLKRAVETALRNEWFSIVSDV
jgi:hypothetical protein